MLLQAGAGPIFEDEGLAEPQLEPLRNGPRQEIGAAAGRIGHH